MSTKADFMINAVGPAVRFIGRLAQIVIALVGCSMLVAGHMTVGVFQAFFQFIYEASEPMTQLSFTSTRCRARWRVRSACSTCSMSPRWKPIRCRRPPPSCRARWRPYCL